MTPTTSTARRQAWRRPALASGLDRGLGPGAPPDDVVAGLLAAAVERDGEARWHARGRSMAGSIRHGTTLRLVSPRRHPLRRGDVVAALLPSGALVVHRVRAVRGGRLVLRGDACRKADPPVSASAVVGVVDPCPTRNWRSLIRRYMP